jgi:hypothetical protein
MKKILVIYFSQSGQLQKAAQKTLQPLADDPSISLQYERLEPVVPFPYPWTYMQFFDAFPETVFGIPCKLKPVSFNADEHFDLVIIAYQPWFLSVSRPVDSFLQSEEASRLLKGKKVITLLACRNMWLNAQEKMKRHLQNLGATLVGNITYVDPSSNLVSLVTVLAFELAGEQGKYLGLFPKYGVTDKTLETKGVRFGEIISLHLKRGNFDGMQASLVQNGAIHIKPNLMIMEGRGKVLFPIYARFILNHKRSQKARRVRVRAFGIILPTLIFLLSPIITLLSRLIPLLFRKKMQVEAAYYQGLTLRN